MFNCCVLLCNNRFAFSFCLVGGIGGGGVRWPILLVELIKCHPNDRVSSLSVAIGIALLVSVFRSFGQRLVGAEWGVGGG